MRVNVPEPVRLSSLASGPAPPCSSAHQRVPIFGGEIVAVGSDRAGTGALERARRCRDPDLRRTVRRLSRSGDWNRAFQVAPAAAPPDLVRAGRISAYLRSAGWSPRFACCQHPSVAVAVTSRQSACGRSVQPWPTGSSWPGATVHWVTEDVDSGPDPGSGSGCRCMRTTTSESLLRAYPAWRRNSLRRHDSPTLQGDFRHE